MKRYTKSAVTSDDDPARDVTSDVSHIDYCNSVQAKLPASAPAPLLGLFVALINDLTIIPAVHQPVKFRIAIRSCTIFSGHRSPLGFIFQYGEHVQNKIR